MDTLPDDWIMEIEMLQAIFMDQIKLKEESKVVEITLWPNPESKDEGDNQVGLLFEITFRKDYPNELPDMMVRPLRGVTSKQSKELLDKLDEQAKEMAGMQMLFSLAQYLKDWLDEQNTDNLAKQKEAARAKDELEIEKEKEEYARKYKDGTPVTVESFKAWWVPFLAAHPEKPQWPVEITTPGGLKLTGKQIFEKGALAGVDLEVLASNSPAPGASEAASSSAAAPSGAKVDWELFADEGDLPDDDEE